MADGLCAAEVVYHSVISGKAFVGNAFNKLIARAIMQSPGRFIAIVVISLLGAGFFAGLRMATPDMHITGDEFFDGAGLYDISVVTTLGLDEGTLEILEDVEGIGAVMPAYRSDAMVLVDRGSYAANVESIPVGAARESSVHDGANVVSDDAGYLNRPILVEGDWPDAAYATMEPGGAPSSVGECVIGIYQARELGIEIGDEIAVERVAGDGDIADTFSQERFVVVGLVNSPAFVSTSMLGTTSLGTGEYELYLYVPPAAFAKDMPYSVAYLSVPAAYGCLWGTSAYEDAVAPVKQRIEDEAARIAEGRWQSVKDDLHDEIEGVLLDVMVDLDWQDDIEVPEVFVLDRSKNPGAASYSSDAEGIAQIATYIPFMFFLVAALVSLTSMTRMVDEERLEIGTHKALGYRRGRITSKYLIYGMLSSGIGSVVGVVMLGKLLPWFILTSYQVMYTFPTTPLPLDPTISAWSVGLSVFVTFVATCWAAFATLRSRPAELMVARAPKAGKRIVLERIPALWRRMSFSQKVTARNLLRYKRRFFMAVIGVAGCTALLMIGFGLRDVISGIVFNQYDTLMSYDAAVRMDDDVSKGEREAIESALADSDVEAYLFVCDFNMVAKGPDDDMRIEVVVPTDLERLSQFVTLRNRVSGEELVVGDDSAVLTEKAARVLGVSVGDTVELYDENDVGDATGEARPFVVDGIAENYLGHYAYLSPNAYRAQFDEEPQYSLAFVKLAPDADAASFSRRLISMDGVNTVSFIADKIVTYQDMLDIMNKLIYVVMLLSAALAFVVLYNLTNINIAERVREIATLKVLGFTRREANVYIFREVIIMAAIGALLGCVIGVPAALSIAEAAETAAMMFGRVIEPASFVFSFVLTMVFASLIAFVMRGKLARVDMVESLKSVE